MLINRSSLDDQMVLNRMLKSLLRLNIIDKYRYNDIVFECLAGIKDGKIYFINMADEFTAKWRIYGREERTNTTRTN
jgi:hypothetical protein